MRRTSGRGIRFHVGRTQRERHLLGVDVGCIERHAFDADGRSVELFHSGYTNVECEDVLDTPDVGYGHSHGDEDGHDHAHLVDD